MTPNEIRAVRAWLGESQDEFGQRLGVSRIAVARWETGARNPSGPVVKLLEQLWNQMVGKGKAA